MTRKVFTTACIITLLLTGASAALALNAGKGCGLTVPPRQTLTNSCQCWAGWTYVAGSGKVTYVGPYAGAVVQSKGPFGNGYAATLQNTNQSLANSINVGIVCSHN